MTFIFFGDGLKTAIGLVLPDNSQEAPIMAKIHVVFSGRFDFQLQVPPNPNRTRRCLHWRRRPMADDLGVDWLGAAAAAAARFLQ